MNASPPTASAPSAPAPPVVLLSVRDVCAVLQCGRTFVYDLLQKGELRAIKLGRLTRIPRPVLDEFIARREAPAMDAAWAEMQRVERRSGGRDAQAPSSRAPGRLTPSAAAMRTVQQCLIEADASA